MISKVAARAIAAAAIIVGAASCGSSSGPKLGRDDAGMNGLGGATGAGGQAGGGGNAGTGGNTATGGKAGTGGTAGAGGNTGAGGAIDAGGGDASSAPLPPALTWTRQMVDTIYEGIWGSGPNDVYAVGRSGAVAHSTGDGTWQSQTSGTGSDLKGVWGSGPNDIYVAALSNVILHSTGGGSWTRQGYTAGSTFRGIWGSGPGDIYAVGPGAVHSTGNGVWQAPPQMVASGVTFAVWGTSATNLYVAQSLGSDMSRTIYHSVGDGTWRSEQTPVGAQMQAIWGVDASHIFAGGGNQILFSTGNGTWTPQLTIADTTEVVIAVWGASKDAVYACTQHGYFYRSNGAGLWSDPQPLTSPNGMICFSLWGTAVDNVYVGTAGGIYHGAP